MKFIRHEGLVVPLDIANVDTDAIIPKQFLQKVVRSGFGAHLFNDWRFLENGRPDPGFILNRPVYKGASILLARDNFGCGSSREHAPWALLDFGIKVVIGQGFADIFYNNAFNNQLLLVSLPEKDINELFQMASGHPGISFTVDLEKEVIEAGVGRYQFKTDPFKRHCLLNGLDNIGLTLQHEQAISDYEKHIPAFMQ